MTTPGGPERQIDHALRQLRRRILLTTYKEKGGGDAGQQAAADLRNHSLRYRTPSEQSPTIHLPGSN